MNIQQQSFHKIGALLLIVLTLLGFGLGQGAPVQAAPLAATVTVDLWAKTGTLTLPGPVNVPIWGYSDTAAGAAQIPGPAIIVNQGDTVNVTLHNDLGEASSLFFGGQALPPDLTGAAAGGTATYSFVATSPGTYHYEAGPLPNAQHQTAMGLYGALIVRPTSAPDVVIPGQAYADPATAYDDEAIVVLSEIDPNLNNSAIPADFDIRTYNPRYWLINGKAHPDTVAIASDFGRKVLLRYVNAGLQYHSMTVLGLNQTVVAKDGSPLLYPYSLAADTIAPGQTADMITTIPATAAPDSRFALYDGNLLTLRNTNAAGFGGMVTFITTAPSGPGLDTTGPTTSGVAVTAGVLSATVDDTATGGSNITAAEYYVDSTTSSATAMSGAFGSPSVAVNATIPPATLTSNHVFYVRGQDSAGNWGPFSSVTYTAPDAAGPTTSALALAPNPSNGTADVTLAGTANDSATGNNNITAAEFFIGAPGPNGTGTAMSVNTASPIAGLSYTIPSATVNALAQGTYQISAHSRDAANNWGAFAQVALKVDKTGPTTSAVSAAPSASNGTTGLSPSQPFVRVQATLMDSDFVVAAASETSAEVPATDSAAAAPTEANADPSWVNRVYMAIVQTSVTAVDAAAVVPGTSYVKTAEGFIDLNPAPAQNGTGFPLTPSDGLFDEGTEDAYVFIPLTTINQLSVGNHTIYIHGQDGAGNWGPTSSIVFIVDKTPPTFSGITLTPNTFAVGSIANVVMTVNGANGTGTAVVGGEYWFGTTDPAPGGGTAFTGLTPNIPVGSLAVGTYTVRSRIRDAAGNWSTGTGGVRSATLTVTPPPPPPLYFSTSGTSNPPGVGGSADDADIYFWNGSTAFSRVIDASAAPYSLPGGANVDGFDRVDATHFYMSFNGNVTIPLPGPDLTVQDEDIVYYNAGTWSLYFDGSARNLESGNFDLDAISIVGAGGPGNVYFSLDSNNSPPGVAGGGDDADIYRWNGGNSYTRLFDASALGWSTTNVDGFVYIDATHFYLSYSGDTTVPVVGAVQDEDVLYYNNGVWSVYFDGTGVGLTSGNLDIDAFDLP